MKQPLPRVVSPDESPTTATVFLCYAREDLDFVQRLHARLIEAGRRVWVDWSGIPVTADWMKQIEAAIDGVETLVFVLSQDSLRSQVCRLELAHALKRGKRIAPIVFKGVRDDDIPHEIRGIQYLSFDDGGPFDSMFACLIAGLDEDQEWTRDHTRLLLRTIDWQEGRGDLLQGGAIDNAERLLALAPSRRPALTPAQVEFVRLSRQHDENQRRVRALQLVSEASLLAADDPGRCLQLAFAAEETMRDDAQLAAVRQSALRIIARRIQLAERDRGDWSDGSPLGLVAGPYSRAALPTRLSCDGRLLLVPTERGQHGNRPPGEVYLVDNETQRWRKLEPPKRREGMARRLEYVGFGRLRDRILLARQFDVELYDMFGNYLSDFYVNCTKYPITHLEQFDADGVLVVGDSTGPVWLFDSRSERSVGMFFRYGSHISLIEYSVSPSGRTAVLLMRDGTAHVWQYSGGVQLQPTPIEHAGRVCTIAHHPSLASDTWMTAAADGSVRIWEVAEGLKAARLRAHLDHDRELVGFGRFLDADELLTVTDRGVVRLWDWRSGQLKRVSLPGPAAQLDLQT